MKNHTDILSWATNYFTSNGYALKNQPEVLLETPWSIVFRFSTLKGDFYLKQTPPTLSMEAQITQLFAEKFHANVPNIISINNELDCFLMKDAGLNLRKYLKTDFKPELLAKAILEYTAIQRSTENNVEAFIALGAPDWRLDKIPLLYQNLIKDDAFLKAENVTDQEQQKLNNIVSMVLAHCESLSKYGIPETIVQYDFNTNNVLYDLNTQKMTSIDLGEIVISHPFLSLHNFLLQAIKHEGLKENDALYQKLHDICLENWLNFTTKDKLLEVFTSVKKLWPLYSALTIHHLSNCVDPDAFRAFYADRPNRFAGYLREYMSFL